jgi:peptidoglycan/LPS O-acetylase OafA/YrhL
MLLMPATRSDVTAASKSDLYWVRKKEVPRLPTIQRVALVAGALTTALGAALFVRRRPATGNANANGGVWASASAPEKAVASRRLTYLPGVDGLRALAVLAVLLYHADLPWIRGGFLGVDVFFVISGYLITTLLLTEWLQRGHINLPAFWLRRARRLLPALFLLMAVTLVFAVLFLSGEVASLRDDALAALGYVTNWYLIFSDQSYFEMMGRPSLFRHLWSLAVEEQFYIVWPLLLTVMMWFLRPRLTLLIVLAGAVASTVLMALLYQPDVDPSRVYYGTDTRGVGLLVGAALAFLWVPGRIGGRGGQVHPLLLDVIGVGGLGVLVYSFLRLDGFDSLLYQGGFALVAVASAVAIAVAVHPRAHLGALLGRQPLRWLGLRSYSVYLWHWPVFMLTRPQLDVPFDGLPLLALRFGVTIVLAEFSYRFVETPIRTGAFGRIWRALREAQGALRWRLRVGWAGAAGVALVSFALVSMSVAGAQRPGPPSYLSVESIHVVFPAAASSENVVTPGPAATATPTAAPTIATFRLIPTTTTRTTPDPTAPAPTPTSTPTAEPTVEPPPPPPTTQPATVETTPTPPPAPAVEGTTEPAPTPTAAAPPPTTPPEGTPSPATTPESTATTPQTDPPPSSTPAPDAAPAARVTAIGDSVMLGAASILAPTIGNIEIDAEVGRQVSAAIDLLRAYRDAGRLGDVVVVHMGNNGTFSASQFDQMMEVLAGVRRVVFVNLRVPRSWEGPNNTVLAEGVARYPNTVLVDWHTASADRPDFFWSDQIHLRPEGAQYYAQLIAFYVTAP